MVKINLRHKRAAKQAIAKTQAKREIGKLTAFLLLMFALFVVIGLQMGCSSGTSAMLQPKECNDHPDCNDGLFCNGIEECDLNTFTCWTAFLTDCPDDQTCDEDLNECISMNATNVAGETQ